jgi:2-polyprenyl-3-methyl-5-hydroxy-6-metoxy-1,4-benzoquinol methylase
MITEEQKSRLEEITPAFGRWVNSAGEWTRTKENVPNTRLRRILQAANDLSRKPLASCRVLDLGCLDGQYSLEFGLHGATVVGLDARDSNLEQARAAKEKLGLDSVEFVLDDARNISPERYGRFDIVVCSGLLYHMNVPDVFQLVERMYDIADHLVIIDTHISLTPDTVERYGEHVYRGNHYVEHRADDLEEVKTSRALASWGNDTSFMLTRPSLVNLFAHVGFSSAYECFNPPHLNYGEPGLEHWNRCAFIAVKGTPLTVHTSPPVNALREDHPENNLTYPISARSILGRIRRKLERLVTR